MESKEGKSGEDPKCNKTPDNSQSPYASLEQLATVNKRVERAERNFFWGGLLGALIWKFLTWATDHVARSNLFSF